MDRSVKLPICIEFDLRYEDYDQAWSQALKVQAEKLHEQARRSSSGWSVTVYALGGGLATLLMVHFLPQLDPYWEIRPRGYVVLTLFTPLMALVVGLGLVHLSTGARRGLAGILGWTVAAAIVFAFFYFSGNADDGIDDWIGTLLPHAAWLLVMSLVLGRWVFSVGQRQRRDGWDMQPNLRRLRKVRIDEEGIAVDEQVEARRYGWMAFRRFSETADTLVLWLSDASFEILPKRSFASPAEMERARQLLSECIRDVDQLPAAFPVLPVARLAEPPSAQ